MASKNTVTNLVKTVNIKANIPVRDVTPPVYGVREGIKMTASDILKCLCKRAIVEQVLSDGSTVRLTTKNFREDFEGELQAKLAAEKEVAMTGENITGSLEGINLLADIDNDNDEGNHNEPEEAKNVVNDDGTVGIEPTHVDPEDNPDTTQEHSETADNSNEESETTEEVPTVQDATVMTDTSDGPVESVTVTSSDAEETTVSVNTTDNTPDTSKVTRKNSSRGNTNKKKRS